MDTHSLPKSLLYSPSLNNSPNKQWYSRLHYTHILYSHGRYLEVNVWDVYISFFFTRSVFFAMHQKLFSWNSQRWYFFPDVGNYVPPAAIWASAFHVHLLLIFPRFSHSFFGYKLYDQKLVTIHKFKLLLLRPIYSAIQFQTNFYLSL